MFLGFAALAVWENGRLRPSRSFQSLLFHVRFFILFSGLGCLWKQFLHAEDLSEFHYLTGSRFHFFKHLRYYTLNPYLRPDVSGDIWALPSCRIILWGHESLCWNRVGWHSYIAVWDSYNTKWGETYSLGLCTEPQAGTFWTATGNDNHRPWGMLVNSYLDLVFST